MAQSMDWKKLQEIAPAPKDSVRATIHDEGEHYAIRIPKTVGLSAMRESNTDKHVPFVSVVPAGVAGERALVTLTVTDGDNKLPLSFRLSPFNLFVAKK